MGRKILMAALLVALLLPAIAAVPSDGSGGAIPVSSCASYDQDCSSLPCCGNLQCKDFVNKSGNYKKCTQPDGICTIYPEVYVAPPVSLGQLSGEGSPLANVTNLSAGTGIIGAGSGIFKAGWFSDWNTMGFIGIAMVVSIIALAWAIGHSFNLPEVKAFAEAEMMQAVVSVLLIAGLLGLVGFFDSVARQALQSSQLPITCTNSEPCYMTSAKFYLQNLYETANQSAAGQLLESVKKQEAASFGISAQLNFWWLLYAGSNVRPNAGTSIDAERAGAIFETSTKLMAALYAQRYFIDVISFGIAPIFLLLGIVMRTFFFTRKLGGLMLAIAISLFIVYPLTYAFAWYTVNVTIYGERTFAAADPACPSECTAKYPAAFFIAPDKTIKQLPTTQEIQLAGITQANWESGDTVPGGAVEFPGLVACRDLSGIGISAPNQCSGCPDYCRDVPFPSGLPGCNITQCSSCNAGCKIIRQRSDCFDNSVCPQSNCPIACRTKLPTENKCYIKYEDAVTPKPVVSANLTGTCGGCGVCPNWCRFVTNASGTSKLVYENDPACKTCNDSFNSNQCPIGCMYSTEIGKEFDCDKLCTDPATGETCSNACRVQDLSDSAWVAAYDVDPPKLAPSCSSNACSICPALCKTKLPAPDDRSYLSQCAPYPSNNVDSANCLNCPEYCRYESFSFITEYSNVIAGTGGVPVVCTDNLGNRLACSSSGSPAECDTSCKLAGSSEPVLCREFDSSPGEPDNVCRKCPVQTRIGLQYFDTGGTKLFDGPPLLQPEYRCDDADCSGTCKPKVTLPNQNTDPACTTDTQTGCPYGCRLTGADAYLSSTCTAPSDFDCTATFGMQVNSQSSHTESLTFSCNSPTTPAFACTKNVQISCSGGGGGGGGDGNVSFAVSQPAGVAPPFVVRSPADDAWRKAPSAARHISLCSGENCAADWGLAAEPVPQTCTETVTYHCAIDAADPSYSCTQDFTFSKSGEVPFEYTEKAGPFTCSSKVPLCSLLPNSCKIDTAIPSNNGYTCSEYLGNGSGKGIIDPIDSRLDPYNDRSNCRQCPENCRINGYEGDCGVQNNSNSTDSNRLVDCSAASCGSECRVGSVAQSSTCQPFMQFGRPCENCPALCRRNSATTVPTACAETAPDSAGNSLSTYCGQYDSATGLGCTSACKFNDPLRTACEGCFECPLDCAYYPAVRSDCSEVCSDESLAGPVNVGPDDFIKKLPGASGALDVKNIGVLMVPALVLPLFCIVIVLAFIRVFSPLLGGDMDIPGLGRII